VKVLRRRRKRRIKTNSTREIIDYPRTRGKKGVKRIKAVSVRGHLGSCLVSSEGLFY